MGGPRNSIDLTLDEIIEEKEQQQRWPKQKNQQRPTKPQKGVKDEVVKTDGAKEGKLREQKNLVEEEWQWRELGQELAPRRRKKQPPVPAWTEGIASETMASSQLRSWGPSSGGGGVGFRMRNATPYSPSHQQVAAPAPRGDGFVAGAGSIQPSGHGASARAGRLLLQGVRLQGCVKAFDLKAGYGFLECPRWPNGDIFVHYSSCDASVGQLHPGDEVEFSLLEEPNGRLRAMDTCFVEEPEPRHTVVPDGAQAFAFQQTWSRWWEAFGRARSPRESKGSAPASVSSGGSRASRVRICNIPWTMTWQTLRDAFAAIGPVLRVDLDEDRVGQAVVTFGSLAAAEHAVEEYHLGTLNGREIVVRHEE